MVTTSQGSSTIASIGSVWFQLFYNTFMGWARVIYVDSNLHLFYFYNN